MNGHNGRGTLKDIAAARVGDHVCWTFDDDVVLRSGLARYVAAGLKAGQRVACYPSIDDVEATRRLLERSVPGMSDAMAAGAIEMTSFEEAYLGDGTFDPDRRLEAYGAMVQTALDDGYAGLRVYGEATAILNDPVAGKLWAPYELRADLLVSRMPIVGVCAYDVRRCDPEAVALLRAVHASRVGLNGSDLLFHLHAGPGGSLAIGGELDFGCAGVLASVAGSAATDVADAMLDLTNLRFIDLAGMRAVAQSVRVMADRHPRVRIRGAGEGFRTMWELLACDRDTNVELEPA